MAKFRFRFDSVEKVKISLEKKVEKELSIINMKIFIEQQAFEKLVDEKNKLHESAFKVVKQKASEIQARFNYETYLDSLIEQKKADLLSLERKKEKIIQELAEKKKDVKIFDSLKEKHLLKYIAGENKAELNLLDEIAGKKNRKEEQ